MTIGLIAMLTCAGCAFNPRPSPFKPVADVRDISGTYRNEPSPPGYGQTSLWRLVLNNWSEKHPRPDMHTDAVRVTAISDRQLKAELLRDGTVIEVRTLDVSRRSDGNSLWLHRGGITGWPAFPLLWGAGEETIEFGREGSDSTKDRLLVTWSGTGQFWVLILPTISGGGGPGMHFLFDRVPSRQPASMAAFPTAATGNR